MKPLLWVSLLLCLAVRLKASDPEITMNAVDLITHWGYPAEEHQVQTDDGYIIKIQRIPYGKSGPTNKTRPVIFMQHGLECSSTNWITNLPNEAAGFVFADAGFDVWLGNMRGNTYGLGHIKYTPKDREFWKFSWDEMAKYDLPAMVDYVLQHTNQDSLYYMGHSQGTLIGFAHFSEQPAWAQKIKKFFALGPVVTVQHIGGAIKYIAPYTKELSILFNLIGIDQFLPSNSLIKFLAKTLCTDWVTNPLCDDILFLIAGANSHQLNDTRVPVYIGHTPAGTSTQNVVHFGQCVNSGNFQMYDYGLVKNLEKYGRTQAPMYDLRKMEIPTYLFWGDLDILADPKDIRESIIPVVRNLAGNYEYEDFNHLDFIWGLRAASEVYQKIISIINQN